MTPTLSGAQNMLVLHQVQSLPFWPHGQEQPEARAEAVLDKGVLGALEMLHMDSFKTYP